MSFRYLFVLVLVLSLFTFGCTTSSQADSETLRAAEREAKLDRKMEAMRIAVQFFEDSIDCEYARVGDERGVNRCFAAIEDAYRFIIETVMQEGQ